MPEPSAMLHYIIGMSIEPQSSSTNYNLRIVAEAEELFNAASDEALLQLFVNGHSRDAIETLVRRYSPLVQAVCRQTVGNRACAEDAFQITFLVLIASARKIRKHQSLAAWLHGVAYRTACRIRQERRLESIEVISNEVADNDPSLDVLAKLSQRCEIDAVYRELEKLPDALRTLVVEHYLHGNSVRELAERRDLTIAAVEGRLKRARKQLRSQLARRGISLSVVVAAHTQLHSYVQSAETESCTAKLLDQLTNADWNAPNLLKPYNINSSLLVSREATMLGYLKSPWLFGTAATLLASSVLFATSQNQLSSLNDGNGESSAIALTSPMSDENTAMVQFQGNGEAQQSDTVEKAATSELPTQIDWQKSSNDKALPAWLSSTNWNIEKREGLRNKIHTYELDLGFQDTPLRVVVQQISDESGTPIYFNEGELEVAGVSRDEIVPDLRGKMSVREGLRRVLSPLELGYRVHESGIEITTLENAISNPALRFYDLSYVLPDSNKAGSVIEAMQQLISPDDWLNGDTNVSNFGSLLIVSATEASHFEIETFLAELSRVHRRNLDNATPREDSEK